MKEVKKFWCQYCLTKTPHQLIAICRVGNGAHRTFWDKLLKLDVRYYWECVKCGERIRRKKRK